jgi:hypothetical protein
MPTFRAGSVHGRQDLTEIDLLPEWAREGLSHAGSTAMPRVPAVYLRSAILAIVANLASFEISNFRRINEHQGVRIPHPPRLSSFFAISCGHFDVSGTTKQISTERPFVMVLQWLDHY